jgi:hypothetical protein
VPNTRARGEKDKTVSRHFWEKRPRPGTYAIYLPKTKKHRKSEDSMKAHAKKPIHTKRPFPQEGRAFLI